MSKLSQSGIVRGLRRARVAGQLSRLTRIIPLCMLVWPVIREWQRRGGKEDQLRRVNPCRRALLRLFWGDPRVLGGSQFGDASCRKILTCAAGVTGED